MEISRLVLGLAFAGGLAAFMAACASHPVEAAFEGGLDAAQARKVTIEYCQSCHVHREFDAASHLAAIPLEYEAEPYRSAQDCKTCHDAGRDMWGDLYRVTRFPGGRLVRSPG